jgi:hypothetical protein
MTTLTLTLEQQEIIGYALRLAVRDQQGKLADCMVTVSDASKAKFRQVEGFRERIARLEDAYSLLGAD